MSACKLRGHQRNRRCIAARTGVEAVQALGPDRAEVFGTELDEADLAGERIEEIA